MRLIIPILFIALLLFGCRLLEKGLDTPKNQTLKPENLTSDESTTNITSSLPGQAAPGACIPGWKCIGKWYKAYQSKNCSWSGKTECPLSCVDGACQAGRKCPSGFQCLDEKKLGYQLEDCTWTNIKTCESSCANASCLPSSLQNTTQNVSETAGKTPETPKPAEPPAPPEDIKKLNLNEEIIITSSNKEYKIRLYNLEPDRAMLLVDGFKSDWLDEGANFTLSSGSIINIREIFFQAYPGGAHAISYVIK